MRQQKAGPDISPLQAVIKLTDISMQGRSTLHPTLPTVSSRYHQQLIVIDKSINHVLPRLALVTRTAWHTSVPTGTWRHWGWHQIPCSTLPCSFVLSHRPPYAVAAP